jgi:hypothetical protein
LFWLTVLCLSILPWLSILWRIPPSLVAVERSSEARQRLTAERNRHQGRAPRESLLIFMGWGAYRLARRIAAISFKLRSTTRFRANGFNRAFSWRNRCLVASVTSALASTRASGVWGVP